MCATCASVRDNWHREMEVLRFVSNSGSFDVLSDPTHFVEGTQPSAACLHSAALGLAPVFNFLPLKDNGSLLQGGGRFSPGAEYRLQPVETLTILASFLP